MKRILPQLLLVLAAAVFFAGALILPDLLAQPKDPVVQETVPEETAPVPEISFAESVDINDVHLRDNWSLYENDDPYDVVTMYLTVQTGNPSDGTDHTWEEVNTYSAYYYDNLGIDRYKVAALLQVGDENGPLPGQLGYNQFIPNATVQVRGQTSSRSTQKNYKIKLFDNMGSWNDQQTIALNKHQGEGLRFRNKLANDLMAEIPQIIGMRTQFVHLYVRDLTGNDPENFVDYGLYTQVEQLNKSALQAHGLDKNGQLYKIESCEFYEYDALKLITDPDYDQKAFEDILEIKGNNDHTKLLEMIHAVNNYSISSDEVLDTYFDRENLAYWMGFMILIGNCDTQNRNSFIYSPVNSNTWYYLPWDSDSSLRELELEVKNRSDFADWERGISNYWGNRLLRRALTSASFREELDAAINDLRANYLTTEHVDELAHQYAEVVKPYVYSMPDIGKAPLTEEKYALVLNNCAQEIELNYQRYLTSLNSPMPFYVGVPVQDGDTLTFSWESAYDMMNTSITYHVILARDYNYEDVLFRQDDIKFNTVSCNLKLEPGQYFLHVNAVNSAGYTMNCFDYYSKASNGTVFGTYCFFVREDGAIEPFANIEGDH